MKHLETYLSRAFVASSIYLLAIILVGVYILAGVFNIYNYSFPSIVELFLKATAVLAVLIVIASATILPGLKLMQKQKFRSPTVIAATTLLIGLIFILLHGIYVKLGACPYVGSPEWYCQVEGWSYLGVVVLASCFSSLVGGIVWAGQKFTKKK